MENQNGSQLSIFLDSIPLSFSSFSSFPSFVSTLQVSHSSLSGCLLNVWFHPSLLISRLSPVLSMYIVRTLASLLPLRREPEIVAGQLIWNHVPGRDLILSEPSLLVITVSDGDGDERLSPPSVWLCYKKHVTTQRSAAGLALA